MGQPVRYNWQLLRTGPLWLDGGGMFGIVPPAIWRRTASCDERGRIELAQNCLLLKPADGRGDPLLIETGSGDKFDAKHRDIYGLTDRCIIDALREVDCRCEDIKHVIVTHLHFDHAGGLTRRPRDGESAGPRLTFPNADVHVQRREWEDALMNRSVMTRTYLPENLEPIRGQLRLGDSPPPYPPGHLPQKTELPNSPLRDRMTEILPSIRVFNVPGHTWGSQAVTFTDNQNRTVVYTPDLIPTAGHVGPAYNMAYDVEPFISTVTRRWFLEEALKNDWLLVLDHEPGEPRRRARRDENDWYRLLPTAD
jgi:glyoxylase-like metal-dependent hydrolase (beta-lactamase superfamily II)